MYEWEVISMFSLNYKVWNDRWGLKGIASGREHEVLLDRRFGLCGSETRSRHPTSKESTDAASETRHPQTRKIDSRLLT